MTFDEILFEACGKKRAAVIVKNDENIDAIKDDFTPPGGKKKKKVFKAKRKEFKLPEEKKAYHQAQSPNLHFTSRKSELAFNSLFKENVEAYLKLLDEGFNIQKRK